MKSFKKNYNARRLPWYNFNIVIKNDANGKSEKSGK